MSKQASRRPLDLEEILRHDLVQADKYLATAPKTLVGKEFDSFLRWDAGALLQSSLIVREISRSFARYADLKAHFPDCPSFAEYLRKRMGELREWVWVQVRSGTGCSTNPMANFAEQVELSWTCNYVEKVEGYLKNA